MPDIKYINFANMDLTKWLEAKPFGPLDSSGRPALRGSIQYDPAKVSLLSPDGFVRLYIDYTDPKCPFRIELTEDPWQIRLPQGTEDIYTFVLGFPPTYKRENILTPKSLFQMYCRSAAVSEVMFQLELTGKTQVPSFPLGSIQYVHQCAPGGKIRKATTVNPVANEQVEVKIRLIHGLTGMISLALNNNTVYSCSGPTAFAADPAATAQAKFGVYDHMLFNEGARAGQGEAVRQQYLAAGIKGFELYYSPITIARRLPGEPAFTSMLEDMISPSRITYPYKLVKQVETGWSFKLDTAKAQLAEAQTANASLNDTITRLVNENDSLKADLTVLNQTKTVLIAENNNLANRIEAGITALSKP
jgi:hypothetical protein